MILKPTKSCSPEVLAQIAEVVPVPVIISNFGGEGIFDHKIAFANSAFTQLTGFKNEHVIGRSLEFLCDRQVDKSDDQIMEFYNKCGYADEFEFKFDAITRAGKQLKLQTKVVASGQAGTDVKSFIISFTEIAQAAPQQKAEILQEDIEDFGIPVAPIAQPFSKKESASEELKQRQKELALAQEQQAAYATAQQVAELQELMRQKQELQDKLNTKKAVEDIVAVTQHAALKNTEAANDFARINAGFVETDYDSIINEIVAELGEDDGNVEETVKAVEENEPLTPRHNVLETMISSIRRKTEEGVNNDERIIELKNSVEDKKIEDEIDYYARTRFLSNMSHDLRTPLNAIIGFSEVIRDQLFGPIDNQRYVSYANDIFKSGQELLGTISEILELSEVESEGTSLQLEEEEFDIAETIESVLDLLSAKAFQTDVKMMKRLQVNNIMMHGDRRKLKQAVGGIIGNAIKCSPSGGKIEIVSEIDENGDFKFITYLKSANLIATRASLGSLLGTVTSKVESEYPEISLAKRFTEAHEGKFSIFNSATSGTEISLTIPKDRLIDMRKAKLQVIN